MPAPASPCHRLLTLWTSAAPKLPRGPTPAGGGKDSRVPSQALLNGPADTPPHPAQSPYEGAAARGLEEVMPTSRLADPTLAPPHQSFLRPCSSPFTPCEHLRVPGEWPHAEGCRASDISCRDQYEMKMGEGGLEKKIIKGLRKATQSMKPGAGPF